MHFSVIFFFFLAGGGAPLLSSPEELTTTLRPHTKPHRSIPSVPSDLTGTIDVWGSRHYSTGTIEGPLLHDKQISHLHSAVPEEGSHCVLVEGNVSLVVDCAADLLRIRRRDVADGWVGGWVNRGETNPVRLLDSKGA